MTETPDVTEALKAAARRWPADRDKPTLLLRHLIGEGFKSIAPEVAEARNSRLAALERAAGAYTGLYEADYLANLRAEWPE